jgi:uncharacterized protein (UPF0548 family)
MWSVREPMPVPRDADWRFFEDEHERELPAEEAGLPEPEGPFRIAADAVLAYRAFPPSTLRSLRDDPRAPVQVGETIRARYCLLPGVHIVFASRVTSVFDAASAMEHRTGFTYRTLRGHPEWGTETFLVRKDLATGRVFASIAARSRPATGLGLMLLPIVRRLQLRAGRAGVDHLHSLARGARDRVR